MDSIMMRDGLKLIRYEYIRGIASLEDLESVKTELGEDNSFFILYNARNDHFTIGKNEELATNYRRLLDMVLPTSEEMLQASPIKNNRLSSSDVVYIFEKNDISLINLVWEYKGEILNTRCVVSKKNGIIFDKFLYFIHSLNEKTIQMQEFSSMRVILSDTVRPISYTSGRHNEAYNMYNIKVFEYGVTCNVYGEWVNGVKYMRDKSLYAYSDHVIGWSAEAEVQEIHFSTGPDGYLNYIWAGTGGTGFNCSVSLNGYGGFSFEGSGFQEGGIEYVGTDELN